MYICGVFLPLSDFPLQCLPLGYVIEVLPVPHTTSRGSGMPAFLECWPGSGLPRQAPSARPRVISIGGRQGPAPTAFSLPSIQGPEISTISFEAHVVVGMEQTGPLGGGVALACTLPSSRSEGGREEAFGGCQGVVGPGPAALRHLALLHCSAVLLRGQVVRGGNSSVRQGLLPLARLCPPRASGGPRPCWLQEFGGQTRLGPGQWLPPSDVF